MKRILITLVLSLMVGSVFATDWVKVYTNKDEAETYDVYLDFDARDPFYIKCESIEYFLLLQDLYEEVEVLLVKDEDENEDLNPLLDFAFENNYYAMRMEYEDYCVDIHINIDGTFIMYIYSGFKNLKNEEQ